MIIMCGRKFRKTNFANNRRTRIVLQWPSFKTHISTQKGSLSVTEMVLIDAETNRLTNVVHVCQGQTLLSHTNAHFSEFPSRQIKKLLCWLFYIQSEVAKIYKRPNKMTRKYKISGRNSVYILSLQICGISLVTQKGNLLQFYLLTSFGSLRARAEICMQIKII